MTYLRTTMVLMLISRAAAWSVRSRSVRPGGFRLFSHDGAWTVQLYVPTPEDMLDVGALLAVVARPPDSLLLDGDLGAGKTCFARGFVECKTGADDSLRVTSPTYLLDNAYAYVPNEAEASEYEPGAAPKTIEIHHMDLYRLSGTTVKEFAPLYMDRIFANCISLIEWPVRLRSLQEHCDVPSEFLPKIEHQLNVNITIEPGSDERRMTLIAPPSSTWKNRLQMLMDEGMLEGLLWEEEEDQ